MNHKTHKISYLVRVALAGLALASWLPAQTPAWFPLEIGNTCLGRGPSEKGDVVYQWPKGKAFTMTIRDETLRPGEKTQGTMTPLADLPPGRYVVRGYLTTDPLTYSGEVSYEIGPSENADSHPPPLAAAVQAGH